GERQAPSAAMLRQMFGGSPTATEADPEAFAQMMTGSEQMRPMFELFKADHDGGQGDGHWAEYLRLVFHRVTQSPGYTFEDLAKITPPPLILFPHPPPGPRPRRPLHPRRRGPRLPAAPQRRDRRPARPRAHHHPRQDRTCPRLLRPAPASELTTMTTIRITTDCTLPPAHILHAAYDFGPRRTQVWPAVHAEHLTVHQLGETTAHAP